MAVRQYIGARYVPKFYENSDNTSEWRNGVIYEPLTIVTWNGNSYTSKKPVPANVGEPSTNTEYWVATGLYNEQIQAILDRINELETDFIVGVPSYVPNAEAANSIMYFAHNNHAFLIDMGHYQSYSKTAEALRNAGVTHIDGVIITHYHGDHDGNPFGESDNYSHWLNDFDFSGCVFYLPNDPPANVTSWDDGTETKLRNTFTQNTFYKPPFNTITWNGYTFTIVNESAAAYAYYSTRSDNYNTYTMAVYVNGHGANIFYASDLTNLAETYLYENGYVYPVDFMTMPHHGVNGDGNTDFAITLSPEKVLVIDGPAADSAYTDPIFTALKERKGTDFISTRTSFPNDIVGSAFYGVHVSGSAMMGGWYGGALNTIPAVHFDANYTRNDGIGTELRPVNTRQKAASMIGCGYSRLVLHSDIGYMAIMEGSFVYIEGNGFNIGGLAIERNAKVLIDNVVITSDVTIANCGYCEISNSTVSGLRPTHATLHLNNVTVTAAIAPYNSIVIGNDIKETGANGYLVYGSNSVVSLTFDLANISATNTGIIYNPNGNTTTNYDDGTPANFVKVYDGYTKRYGYDRANNKPFVIYGGQAHYLALA